MSPIKRRGPGGPAESDMNHMNHLLLARGCLDLGISPGIRKSHVTWNQVVAAVPVCKGHSLCHYLESVVKSPSSSSWSPPVLHHLLHQPVLWQTSMAVGLLIASPNRAPTHSSLASGTNMTSSRRAREAQDEALP